MKNVNLFVDMINKQGVEAVKNYMRGNNSSEMVSAAFEWRKSMFLHYIHTCMDKYGCAEYKEILGIEDAQKKGDDEERGHYLQLLKKEA